MASEYPVYAGVCVPHTYDAVGNRLSATTGATSIGSIGVGDGNRTLMNVSGGAKVFYTYNAADQLTGVTQNSSSGTTTQTSVYGVDPVTGQRLTLADTGKVSQTNLFVYDPTTGNSLLVLSASGAVIERDLPGMAANQTLAFETGMTGSGSGTVFPDNQGGNGLIREAVHTKYSTAEVRIPAAYLHAGENTITLTLQSPSSASYVMYDCLSLETP